MTILKVALYTLLAFCTIWILLIFAGSTLIKVAADIYFEKQFKSHMINVSSTLDLEMTRVELEFQGVEISSNSIIFDWSLFDNGPYARLSLGPTLIEGLGAFDSASIKISSTSILSWKDPEVLVSLGEFSSKNSLNFGSLDLVGKMPVNWDNLNNVVFKISGVSSQMPPFIKIDEIIGEIDEISLSEKLKNQNNIGNFQLNNIESEKAGLKVYEIFADIKNTSGKAKLNANFVNIDFLNGKFLSESMDLTGLVSLETFETEWPIKINVNSARQVATGLFLKSLVSEVSLENDTLVAEGSAKFEKSEIRFDNNVYGVMPDKPVLTKLEAKKAGEKISLNLQILSNISVDPSVNLEGILILDDLPFENFFDCVGSSCDSGDLNFEYVIGTSGGGSNGSLKCYDLPCYHDNMMGEFYFSDTIEFFSDLSKTKIFNPLTLAYLYAQVLGGQKIGKDHSLKFSN